MTNASHLRFQGSDYVRLTERLRRMSSTNGAVSHNGTSTRDLVVTRVRGFGEARNAAVAELAAHGITLPFPQRAEFLKSRGNSDAELVVVRDESGAPLAAACVGIATSRTLLLHQIIRLNRLSATAREDADHALLASMAEIARSRRLVLRLTVELFERDAARRARLARSLATLGFHKAPQMRNYGQTLAMDLGPTEAELFASLKTKARRDIRQASKRGLTLKVVDDPAFAPRVAALENESYAWTGANRPALPWTEIIELSERDPGVSRIVGLFDPAKPGHDGLVSFAWGFRHGECATYEAGAMTRRANLGNTPLGYAPLWHLIAWARGTDARWFDFGGITCSDTDVPSDPFAGISDFKRHFCSNVVEIAEDWSYAPRPVRASISDALSAAAHSALPRALLPQR